MTATILIAPDKETPLLGGKGVPAVEVMMSVPSSEAATLVGPSSQGSWSPSVKGSENASGILEPLKKTPLPWAQFSIVLFFQLAEPLTAQVIYPVSPTLGVLN